MSQLAAKNNIIFPCNDMGHLEFRDACDKLISTLELHRIIGKDIDMNVRHDGFVSFHSKYKSKTYTINGNSIYVDFSKL
jgi:hypothetical protein